jgi:hypothetical protein
MRKEAPEAGIWQTKTVHGPKHPQLQILFVSIPSTGSGQAVFICG